MFVVTTHCIAAFLAQPFILAVLTALQAQIRYLVESMSKLTG